MVGCKDSEQVGVVVIGRNEGERVKRCLRSLIDKVRQIVYVDSGSTDGSVEFAKTLMVDVVNLDMSQPFTMARARNEGFNRLVELNPDTRYVQFVDGDCEVVDSWLDKAHHELNKRVDVAVVCGRRRERFPDATIYNRLCDMEWNTPVGDAKACGGDAMMRANVFRQIGGFRPDMIAGEEPELCFRIRHNGWKIFRLDEEMTIHDAAIWQFRQFWRRNVRSGHAYAEGALLHGGKPERYNIRNLISAFFWGGMLPAMILLCFMLGLWKPVAFIGVGVGGLIYLAQGRKIYYFRRSFNDIPRDALLYAFFCLIAKLPELIGILIYVFNCVYGQRTKLIEYKFI